MFEFAWLWIFLLLPLPVLVRLFAPPAQEQSSSLKVPFFQDLNTFVATGQQKNWLTIIVACIIWLLLIVAAARPQWVGDKVSVPTEGRDIMLAVDLSGSMARNDMVLDNRRATRLQVVKKVGTEFILRRKGDRLGLILFATNAFLQAPFTNDVQSVAKLLEESFHYERRYRDQGLAGRSTSIGNAIALATKLLVKRPEKNRVLILLSDGHSTDGINSIEAAQTAKEAKVRIHTIGFGPEDTRELEAIAQHTDGKFYRALDAETLQRIYAEIDVYEPIVDKPTIYQPRREFFYWPLALAFLLSIALVGLVVARRGHE